MLRFLSVLLLVGLLALLLSLLGPLPAQQLCGLGVATLHVVGYSLLTYVIIYPPAKTPTTHSPMRLHHATPARWQFLKHRLFRHRCLGYLLLWAGAIAELLALLWLHRPPKD